MIPEYIKIAPLTGSGDSSVQMTMEEYTGRVPRPASEIWVYDTDNTVSDMVEVSQKAKTEFISINEPLVYSIGTLGGEIVVTGSSNCSALLPVGADPLLEFALEINGEPQSSWSPDNPYIEGDIGTDSEYTWTLRVTVPENKSGSEKTWTFHLSNNDQIDTAVITINQAEAVKTYSDITVSLSYNPSQIGAEGGSSSPVLSYSQTWGWNGSTTGGGTITSGASVSYSGDHTNASSGVVTLASRGTTAGDTLTVTSTVTVSMNGKTASKSATVTQEANTATYGNVTISGGTVADIPASGGSVSSMSGISASQTVTYTSGATKAGSVNITYSAAVSAPSLGTTVKGRTVVGQLTATATGEGNKSATKTLDVYQQANVQTQTGCLIRKVYGSPNPPDAVPAAGGTVHIDCERQYSYTSGATSSVDTNEVYLTTEVDWCVSDQLSDLTITGRGTEVGGPRSTQVYWQDGAFKSNEMTITQLANEATSITYGVPTVNITVSDISAAGGTVSAGNVTYSQSRVQHYSSGATSTLSNLTTGGTVSYSTAVTAASLGTTVKNRTKVGTLTATVTMNGQSGSATADVYQAKNIPVSIQTYANFSYPSGEIPASGGTKSPITAGGCNVTFSSGETQTGLSQNDYEGFSLTILIKYAFTSTVTGFSINKTSGVITARSRGAGEGAARTSAIPSRTLTSTLTIDSEFGGGELTDNASYNADVVTQAKNVIVSITGQPYFTYQPNQFIPAEGGSSTPSFSQMYVTLEYSSGSVLKNVMTNNGTGSDTAYYTLTIKNTFSWESPTEDFSLNSSTGVITAAAQLPGAAQRDSPRVNMHTDWSLFNKIDDSTVTTATDYLGEKVRQRANEAAEYGPVTVNVSAVNDIPASGGSVNTATVSYSQTVTYPSGSTTVITSGGRVSFNTVTAESKGTTLSNRTQVGTLTATVVLNGVTGTGSVAVYQAKNVPTSIDAKVARIFSYPNISPSATSASPNTGGSIVDITYSSGSVQQNQGSGNSMLSYAITYTLETVQNGFTAVNSSNGVLTATNMGTTLGSRVSGTVTKKVVWTCTIPSQYGGGTLTDTVIQTASCTQGTNSATYTISLSAPAGNIPAGGGTKIVTRSGSISYTSGSTGSFTPTLSISSSAGFSLNGTTVTAADRGTTEGAERSCTVTASYTGATPKTVTIKQDANTASIVYGNLSVTLTVADIPAGGGSISSGTVTYSQSRTQNFTSGASIPLSDLTSGGSISYGPEVTAPTKGITVSGRTDTGKDLTVTVTMNGKSGSASASVYQQANIKTAGDISYGDWQVSVYAREYISPSSPCPASGDSFTIYSGASRTRVQNYNYTSGATDTETLSTETATPELSVSGEGGLTLDGNTATYANRGTTEGNLRSNTILATYEGAYDTEQVYQEANVQESTIYGTPEVTIESVADIPASGGSVSTGTCSYSQSRTYTYTSGATFEGSPLVMGGTVTWTTVSAESKGTTISGRTSVGTITCTVTMNGKSGSDTATVYQAANEITSTELGWKSFTNNTEPQSGRGVYSGDTIQIEFETAAASFVGFPIEYLYYHYTSGEEYAEHFGAALNSTTITSNVSFISAGTSFGVMTQNTSTSPRSGTVTCTYEYEDETYTLNFNIIQPGATNHLEVSPTSFTFGAVSERSGTITIKTNESWTIS